MQTTHSKSSERFVFVDALRGIAALMVLIDHSFFNNNTEIISKLPLFHPIPAIISHGTLGVQIFFVLSGFVIAHSLRNVTINKHEIFNFILRRQIRLDPPYWAILIATLALSKLESFVPGLETAPLPSVPDIMLNMTYLYWFFGAQNIVQVAWTLCIEVQFYLAFIFLLGVVHRFAKVESSSFFIGAVVWLSGVLSLSYAGWIFGGDYAGPYFSVTGSTLYLVSYPTGLFRKKFILRFSGRLRYFCWPLYFSSLR